MKTFEKYRDKLLSCIPSEWADFYRKAPKEFDHEYVISKGFTRDAFLEMANLTKLYDFSDYENSANRNIYKDDMIVHPDCYSWMLNKKELDLYNAMPDDIFSQDVFRSKRLSMGIPIRSQDKMLDGTLFDHIDVEGQRYYDLKKNRIKPILK